MSSGDWEGSLRRASPVASHTPEKNAMPTNRPKVGTGSGRSRPSDRSTSVRYGYDMTHYAVPRTTRDSDQKILLADLQHREALVQIGPADAKIQR